MIHLTRACLLGRNCSGFPILRAVIVPKHNFPQYCISASEKEKDLPEQTEPAESLRKSIYDMKYSFLRDVFNDSFLKNPYILKKESILNDFLDKLHTLGVNELVQVFKLLADIKKRPVAAIHALCEAILKQGENITVQHCATLLNCLNNLSYRDENMIKLIMNTLKTTVEFESPRAVCSLLHSMARMRVRDCEVIDKLLKYILQENRDIRTLLICLKAACNLNYSSVEVEEIIKLLAQQKPTDFIQTSDYINFIWACLLLNKGNLITSDQIAIVLSDSHVTKIICNGPAPPLKWKLLNINGAVKELPSYEGPILDNHTLFKMLTLSTPSQRSVFLNSVLDSMVHIVPDSGTLRPLVNTGAGFFIDLEYTAKIGVNDLKVAVVLLNFTDLCTDQSLTGNANFRLNFIKGKGYKTVILRHTEYKITDPLKVKIAYLRKKIEETVPEMLTQKSGKKQKK